MSVIDLKAAPPGNRHVARGPVATGCQSTGPALALVANCGDGTVSVFTISGKTVALGRRVDANNRVTVVTTEFAPKDSVFASVHSTGDRTMKLTARWTFQNGKVIAERSETISPKGDAAYVANIGNGPTGSVDTISVLVLVDSNEVQTKDFTVVK
jgi:hypothetical protein